MKQCLRDNYLPLRRVEKLFLPAMTKIASQKRVIATFKSIFFQLNQCFSTYWQKNRSKNSYREKYRLLFYFWSGIRTIVFSHPMTIFFDLYSFSVLCCRKKIGFAVFFCPFRSRSLIGERFGSNIIRIINIDARKKFYIPILSAKNRHSMSPRTSGPICSVRSVVREILAKRYWPKKKKGCN